LRARLAKAMRRCSRLTRDVMPESAMQESESRANFPPFEAFYIEMLLWHTRAAKASIDAVTDWLKLVEAEDERALHLKKSQLFGHLQSIVQQAGAVSRYLWPSKPGKELIHEKRASRLRAALGVDDENPLKARGLRNGLEHFDEKLDLYLSQNFVGEFVPEYVDYVERQREIPTHIFKAFYTHPLKFVLLGQSYELAPVVNEILRLHRLLEECQNDGHRLPNVRGA
jgi:hypothetical protein